MAASVQPQRGPDDHSEDLTDRAPGQAVRRRLGRPWTRTPTPSHRRCGLRRARAPSRRSCRPTDGPSSIACLPRREIDPSEYPQGVSSDTPRRDPRQPFSAPAFSVSRACGWSRPGERPSEGACPGTVTEWVGGPSLRFIGGGTCRLVSWFRSRSLLAWGQPHSGEQGAGTPERLGPWGARAALPPRTLPRDRFLGRRHVRRGRRLPSGCDRGGPGRPCSRHRRLPGRAEAASRRRAARCLTPVSRPDRRERSTTGAAGCISAVASRTSVPCSANALKSCMCCSDCLRKAPGIKSPTSRIIKPLNRYSFSLSQSVVSGPVSVAGVPGAPPCPCRRSRVRNGRRLPARSCAGPPVPGA